MRNIYDNSEFFAAYAEMGRSKDGLKAAGEWHQLQPLFPKLQGKKVLDLGCGYGWHCKYAAQMGATEILGIDSSQKMIAKAVADNSDDKIKYKVCGVEEYIYPENTYDLVVSNLVLHYIENLANIYQKVYCTLKVGGYFLFNIEHPTFTAGVNEDWIYDENGKPKYWPIDNYYYTGERETNFLGQRVIKQHHTLTQILNPLIKCGFQIEAIEEAMPPADMMGMPGMCDEILPRQIIGLHAHVHPFAGLRVKEEAALCHFLFLHAVGQVAAVALVPALQPAIVAHPHKTFDDINIQNTHLQTPLYFQMRLHSTFRSYFFTSSNHAPSTGTPFRRQYSSQTSPKGRVFSSSCRTISSVNWLVSCSSFSAAWGVHRADSSAFSTLRKPTVHAEMRLMEASK